jgi:hypothetical protein
MADWCDEQAELHEELENVESLPTTPFDLGEIKI